MVRQNASDYEPLRSRGKRSLFLSTGSSAGMNCKVGGDSYLLVPSKFWRLTLSYWHCLIRKVVTSIPDQVPIKALFYLHNSLNHKYEYGKKKALEAWLPHSRTTPVGEDQQQTLVCFLSPTKWVSFALSSDSSSAVGTWQSAWGGLWLVTLLWHASVSGLAEEKSPVFHTEGTKEQTEKLCEAMQATSLLTIQCML